MPDASILTASSFELQPLIFSLAPYAVHTRAATYCYPAFTEFDTGWKINEAEEAFQLDANGDTAIKPWPFTAYTILSSHSLDSLITVHTVHSSLIHHGRSDHCAY